VKMGRDIQSVVRLANGHTLLGSRHGIIELDRDNRKTADPVYGLGGFFRLLRVTKDGHFLYTSGPTTVREIKRDGTEVRGIDLTKLTPESRKPYFAEELQDGSVLVSTGYGATVLILDRDWKLIRSFGGKGNVNGVKTHFFGDAQRLENGNIVVAHWTGHGRKDSGKAPQAIEFGKRGNVVWTWHDPKRAGTLHGIEAIE